MSETGEMPPGVEVQKNPVVEATRGAVRTALEANESYQDWRNKQEIREKAKGLFRVYNSWEQARKEVVGVMTEADRKSLQTKLLELKMKMIGMTGSVLDITLNLASKAMFWGGGGLIGVVAFGPLTWPVAGIGAGVMAAGVATGLAREGVAGYLKLGAKGVSTHETRHYKYREALLTKRKSGEALKAVVGEKVRDIVTGFAYPEGKPVTPPPAKV